MIQLGRSAPQEATPLLENLVDDADPRIKSAAAKALQRIRG